MKGNVVIIGGGIIGLFSAFFLINEGWNVTIVERGELNDGCSLGNAGMIVPSHFIPMAAPGMLSQGLKWMLDSKSPFYVKPVLNLSLISWGLKFVKSATEAHVIRSGPQLRDLHMLSKQLYKELDSVPEFDFGLENHGILMLYKTQHTGTEEIQVAEKARKLGLDAVVLNSAEVQDLEPGVELNVAGAVHYRCDGHLNPNVLIPQLVNYLKKNGAAIYTGTEVTGFEISAGEVKSVETRTGKINADLVVMTGGSWLPALAKFAGMSIPVMPGKGYSFMESNAAHPVKHPSLLLEARVAVTPMNGQLRFGGTMEIAPINDKINMNRVAGIVEAIPRYYPQLKVETPKVKDIWYGFRPCSPDGLPYVGYSKKIKNMIVAGGHGMMGVSLAPATGKIVSELANGSPLSAGIALYDPLRFS